MKLSEMQDKLENLQNDLSIISQTANAVETSLDEGVLTPNQVGWAMVGIVRSLEAAIKDTGELVKESIGMKKILEQL